MSESCLGKKASTVKTADGAVLYLVEEIGDARVRLAQLKNYVKEGLDLVEKSDQKDHFFEMAGHLLLGIPDTIFKLEKALGAAAMAAARLDYEEVKQTLKPEKAEELENVLPDVRLRQPRRSEENSMTPKQAAEHLLAIADETETTGIVPVQEVMTLLATLEAGQTKKASTPTSLAHSFRAFAKSLQSEPNRLALASRLRHVLADVTADARDMKINPRIDIQRFYQNCVRDDKTPSEAVKQLLASGADRSAVKAFVGYWWPMLHGGSKTAEYSEESVGTNSVDGSSEPTSRFEEGVESDPTENMSEDQKKEWKVEHLKNKDNFKSSSLRWKK